MNDKLNLDLVHDAAVLMRNYIIESEQKEVPVVQALAMPMLKKELKLDQIDWSKPHSNEDTLLFIKNYLRFSTHLHHPGYIAHQVGVPNQGCAIADFINAIANNGVGVYEMGPSSVVCENYVLNWLLNKAGLAGGSGALVHGGALANLTALLSARARALPNAWHEGNDQQVIYLVPETSHYSITRAVSIMGHGEHAIWYLPSDHLGRIATEKLPAIYRDAKEQGKKIVAMICNACATATGIYDDIAKIGKFCNEHNIWLHVDGAHGASALLSRAHRHLLAGIEQADSITWDMHKMLQTSTVCAAVLYKASNQARATFYQDASYLQHCQDETRDDVFEKSIECTKTALSFRFLLNLYINGEDYFVNFINNSYQSGQEFYELINNADGFSCPFKPQSNILLFRYGDDDTLQEQIYNGLIQDGNFYISKARFKGNSYLRLSIMNQQTKQQTILAMLDKIKSIAISRCECG